MTLAQISTWTRGHATTDRLVQGQNIAVLRAALTADDKALDRMFSGPASAEDRARAEAETLAAFGLSESDDAR